ncbi:hypothetical protein ACE6H2_008137 [Prunus campanulata]
MTTGGVPVPLGFRFHPTDEELVDHYLKNKRQDRDFNVNHIIPEIDICKYDPWDIPGLLFTEQDSPYHDMEWFFFSRRDYKYINSNRSNRATPHGSWKITGKERMIRARGSNAVIGTKRTMTFYERGVLKSKKTNWVMHEYSEASPDPQLAERDFVLYRLKKNPDKDTSVFAAADVTPESQDHSPSALQSPACIEQGDVLQSPFGDISTSDFENEVTQQSPAYRNLKDLTYIDDSDFGNQTANNMVLEQPSAQDYYSYTLQSPIYTELGSVPHVDVYENQWQSTYDNYEQVSNSNANFENQTTDGRISEEFPQPKENLRSVVYAHQLEDYPSQPLMNIEECQMRPCEIGIEGAAGLNWEGSFFHFP